MQEETSELEFCDVDFKQFLERSKQLIIKIVGSIKSIFASKKYIIQVYFKDQILIRTIKKYNEFEATYQVIKMKYRNFDTGHLPSKYQMFGKDQSRKQYFEFLMNKIIENYNSNSQNQANKRLLSIIYLFLTKSLASKDGAISFLKKESQSLKNFERKRKLSLNNLNNLETTYNEQKQVNKTNLKNKIQLSQTKPGYITQYQIQKHRIRRNSEGSIIQFQLQKDPQNKSKNNNFQSKNISKKNQFQSLSSKHQIRRQNKNYFQFQIKFEHQNEWKKRFLKIQNSSLLVFKDKMENHFRTKIQLYRIQVDYYHREKNFFDHFCQKMQINNQPTFKEDKSIITISHQNDLQKMLIKGLIYKESLQNGLQMMTQFQKKQQIKLQQLKRKLKLASQISSIKDKFQGVFNPIGKVFIVIHKLTVGKLSQNNQNILNIKINNTNFEYECKKLLLKQQNVIKQSFFIPISNCFQTIYIEANVIRQQGWIREEFKIHQLGYHAIQFSQILTKSQGFKNQKINVALKRDSKVENQFSNSEVNLQYTIQNFSDFSSIYSDSFANQNDGKIIQGLKWQDMDQLTVTVDRALRIIGNIALLITCFWRNVYLFKYPKLAQTFFSILLTLFLTVDAKTFISIVFSILIFIILYNHPLLKLPLQATFQYLFFSQIHPNFIQPQCLGTSQIKYRKWSQSLQDIAKQFQFTKDNRLQKNQNFEKQNYIQYKFKIHQRTFTFTQQVKGILGKVFEGKKIIEIISRMISGFVNSIQKFANLFLWVDFKRSCFILFLLVLFSGVASDFLVRIIGSIFCIHRLYKGKNFYKLKHYARNRKTALFTIRYIINKHFPNLISNQTCINNPNSVIKRNQKNYINVVHIQQLQKIICELQFPLGDEGSSKKLKSELQKLICVYLDIDQLKKEKNDQNYLSYSTKVNEGQKQNKQSQTLQSASVNNVNQNDKKMTIKVGQIVRIIETCQTRLSLDWVPGKQGLSNQFQELRELTKQTPFIDVWIQHLIINFVLNIPSQMFIKLKKIKQQEKQKQK